MLDLLKQENPVYCGGLIDIIKESIQNRFEKYNLHDTRAKDSILAAVSYPFFKLKWVPRAEKEYVKELFIAELRRFKQEDFKSAHPQTSTLKKKQKSESYYMFNDSDSSTTSTDGNSSTCTDLEALQYLRDEDTSLNILNTYPTIKKKNWLPVKSVYGRKFYVTTTLSGNKEISFKVIAKETSSRPCNAAKGALTLFIAEHYSTECRPLGRAMQDLNPRPSLGYIFGTEITKHSFEFETSNAIRQRCVTFLMRLVIELQQRLPDNYKQLEWMQLLQSDKYKHAAP
ncbi:hypothetical protein EVAR_49866_1 [Eumeta japonica]|uniref:Uncharacterized protein n=1 Tax=Eumeta variegata TaxID=151549 RepID=A0A4C1XWH0_EUMVA|nr:hypothetical protein EVAR_49866_1 [Eumeta japonica]